MQQNHPETVLIVSIEIFEVPRGKKMLYSGTDPESYITEYTLEYENCLGEHENVDVRGQREQPTRQRAQHRALAGPVRKVAVRLPGKGNSNSHGARPVHLIVLLPALRFVTGVPRS